MILRGLTILCAISSALISCNRSKYFRTTLAGREYPAGYDRNGDGITDIQAIRAQLNPADPNLASEDTDGDGLTNLWEIKLGFDPKVADSANSLNGNKSGGNGVTDCQEDLVGDGIPICWKIKNGIDPAKGNRSLTDLDGDGYSDLEEYLAGTDPNSANSRPGGGTADENGALAAVLTLKGTTSEYTEITRVTGTMSYCTSGEQVLFTSGATKPEVNDAGFVACSTAADVLSGTLAAVKTGTYKMYVWRKIVAGVVGTPLSASILYAPRATDGGLSVHPYSNKTLSVALAAPPGTQYTSVRLIRYSELNCSSRTVDDPTGTQITAKISDSLVLASGLSYATPYCFKAFWTDAVGNVATRFGSYPGVGPVDGTLTISGFDEKTIKLAHTLPTDENYRSLKISRFETTCAALASGTAASISLEKTATIFSDANLKLATPYCYQATWADAFGNGKTATVEYAGTGPGAGNIEITGFAPLTINLKQNPVGSPVNPISKTELTRYQDLTCSSATTDTAIVSPTSVGASTYTDSSGLTLNKSYCYKMAWLDVFGNSSTKSVSFAGTGPTDGAMDAALDAADVNLLITPPTAPPPSSNFTVNLTRYDGKDSCANPTEAANKSFTPAPISTDKIVKDAGGGFLPGTNYCYKIIWTDDFGNSSSAIKSIKFSSPTFTAPNDLILNGSGTVTGIYTATLDDRFSDTRVLKVLIGNGSGSITSNGIVPFAQSDIPGLTYTDSAECNTTANPFICPQTSIHSGTITTDVVTLGWNHTKFDQGIYDIKTLSYLNVDGTKNYGGAATIPVTIANATAEETPVHQNGSINYLGYSEANKWFRYQPALALTTDLTSSTGRKQTYGIAYTASVGTDAHFIGKVVIDRDALDDRTNPENIVTAQFNDSGTTSPLMMQGASDQANEDSVAIATSTASSSDWLILSGIGDNASKRLQLAKVSASNLEILRTWVSANNGSTISSIAITPAFSDHESTSLSTKRHGIAFAATSGATKGVFVSKMRSVPSAEPTSNNFLRSLYFDSTNYYDASNRINGSMSEAIEVTNIATQIPNLSNHDASLVQITISNVNETNYFYVGWRDHADSNVKFARIIADGTSSPISSLAATKPSDYISNMGFSTTWGRAAYGMAAGFDDGTTPSPILGVLYAKDGPGIQNCWFRAYKYLSTNIQIEQVGTDTQVGTTTDCRFPHLFWNASSKKFMAVWTDGGTGTVFGPTMYTEFTFGSTNNTPDLTRFTPVIVTPNRSNRTINSNYTSVCKLAAQYEPGISASTPARIGIITVESSDCEQGDPADMRLDLYKPAR